MIQIAALLAGWPARIGVVVAGIVALFGLRAWDKQHQQAIGAGKVVAKIEKAANENARKADDARRSVERVPADRLRDRYARD
jgi:predicted negative regulator of RcsB-dependent stress response